MGRINHKITEMRIDQYVYYNDTSNEVMDNCEVEAKTLVADFIANKWELCTTWNGDYYLSHELQETRNPEETKRIFLKLSGVNDMHPYYNDGEERDFCTIKRDKNKVSLILSECN